VFSRNRGERNICRLIPIGTRLRERAVLTLRCARTISWSARLGSRLGACLGAAAALSALAGTSAWSPAHADGIAVGGCVGSRYSINCVARWGAYSDPYIRLVAPPQTEAEKALNTERDRKWQAHCRPAVFQDHYGVPRYEYAAPGCEFGVIE
jgi:hypothetical protein